MVLASLSPSGVELMDDQLTLIRNQTGLALLLSVGQRTGLLEHLARSPQALTAAQLAARTTLADAHVARWLADLDAAGVVQPDGNPASLAYRLLPQWRRLVTGHQLARSAEAVRQSLRTWTTLEEQVLDAFFTGQPLPEPARQRYEELCSDAPVAHDGDDHDAAPRESFPEALVRLVPHLAPLLEDGVAVLDARCGSGTHVLDLACAYPNSTFAGYDPSQEMIYQALRRSRRHAMHNLRFEEQDAAAFNETETFDFILLVGPAAARATTPELLARLHTALKPNGTLFVCPHDLPFTPSTSLDESPSRELITLQTLKQAGFPAPASSDDPRPHYVARKAPSPAPEATPIYGV